MRRISAIAVLTLALSGCDKIVERKYDEASSYQEEGTVSCTKTSVCYTCMPGMRFDGKMGMNCSMKLSTMCPGVREAIYRVTPTTLYYESGTVKYTTTRSVVSTEGPCL